MRSSPQSSDKPIDNSALDTMVYWIRERERIRMAKESGAQRPWTRDPLLMGYRWCNVSRMDDKVSQQLFAAWYPHDGAAAAQLAAAALGRLCNWPEAILDANDGAPYFDGCFTQIRAGLHARAARGLKCFGGAYVLPGVPGQNKIDSTLNTCEEIARQANILLGASLRSTWEALTRLPGLGSFLAGQIAADVAQMSSGAEWRDGLTWAPVGPGSARGMNRLRGRPFDQPVSQERFDVELPDYILAVTPAVIEIVTDRKLCAQDFQSTLCEFDKYLRLSRQEGKVRARYAGAGDDTTEHQLSLFSAG